MHATVYSYTTLPGVVVCVVGISVKKEVTKPSRCMSNSLCHKGDLDCSENREIKSPYLLQREATMGDI